ncbi:uncharacterized protein METZ01_LOCUS434322, partial [marine metagenome]
MSDFFASPLISQILTWIFSIPIIFGLLAYVTSMLFDEMEEMSGIYIWWIFICIILFSPLRYIVLQIFVATAFPFQSFTGFLQSILLTFYIPIVFALLYTIGFVLPALLVVFIIGTKNYRSKARLFLSGIVAPLIFLIFSSFYYNLLPYVAYSTHWVEAKALIRSTNGPSYYFYRYAVEQFTPLQFSDFAHELGLENLDT